MRYDTSSVPLCRLCALLVVEEGKKEIGKTACTVRFGFGPFRSKERRHAGWLRVGWRSSSFVRLITYHLFFFLESSSHFLQLEAARPKYPKPIHRQIIFEKAQGNEGGGEGELRCYQRTGTGDVNRESYHHLFGCRATRGAGWGCTFAHVSNKCKWHVQTSLF